MKSRRPKQDCYLKRARDKELKELVDGIICISKKTEQKAKYLHLLERLSNLGLVEITHGANMTASLKGAQNKVQESGLKPTIVYVQPICSEAELKAKHHIRENEDRICFFEFAHAIKGHGAIANRFALSLLEWAEIDAGSAKPGA